MDWIGLDPTQKSSPIRAPCGAKNNKLAKLRRCVNRVYNSLPMPCEGSETQTEWKSETGSQFFLKILYKVYTVQYISQYLPNIML